MIFFTASSWRLLFLVHLANRTAWKGLTGTLGFFLFAQASAGR
jgi:hypothetical protein